MDTLVVGRIRRPHGVRGSLLVAVDTDRPSEVFGRGKVLHLGSSRGDPVGRTLTVKLIRNRPPDAAIVDFEEVNDRDVAAELRGHTLLIDSELAAPAGDDEIHYRDLVGLSARADGAEIGNVEDVMELSAGPFLVVRRTGGAELLIPMVPEFVQSADPDSGVLELKLPEGMLDI